MSIDFEKLQRKSEAHTKKLVEKQTKIDIENYDAEKELEHLPYRDENLLFEQVDRKIQWKSRGQRYASSRHFPSKECAAKVMELLKEIKK